MSRCKYLFILTCGDTMSLISKVLFDLLGALSRCLFFFFYDLIIFLFFTFHSRPLQDTRDKLNSINQIGTHNHLYPGTTQVNKKTKKDVHLTLSKSMYVKIFQIIVCSVWLKCVTFFSIVFRPSF